MTTTAKAKDVKGYLKQLYENSLFTDVTLNLKGGRQLKAHKTVLTRCDFFRAALTGNFKEAQENTITFPEDDAVAMEALVMWLYGYTLDEWKSAKVPKFVPTTTTIDIHKLAIKYDLPDLATDAAKFCGAMLKKHFSTSIQLGNEATGKRWLWSMAKRMYQDETSAPLIDVLLATMRSNRAELLALDKTLVREAFLKCPELAVDLLMGGGLTGHPNLKWT